MNPLLIIGLLINCTYVCVNRFWKRLPNYIAIPILLLGIALMLTGSFLSKQV